MAGSDRAPASLRRRVSTPRLLHPRREIRRLGFDYRSNRRDPRRRCEALPRPPRYSARSTIVPPTPFASSLDLLRPRLDRFGDPFPLAIDARIDSAVSAAPARVLERAGRDTDEQPTAG